LDDVISAGNILGVKLGPKTAADRKYKNLTDKVWRLKKQPAALSQLIAQTGKIKKSLG